MASSVSHRVIAAALKQLKTEKEERLLKNTKDSEAALAIEEEKKLQELSILEDKRKKLIEEKKSEEAALAKMREEIQQEEAAADEERRLFKLQDRMDEFRGASDEDLKRRLIAEGYTEQLVNDFMRRRTNDARLEREGGLQEVIREDNTELSRSSEDPLERIIRGDARFYDITNRLFLNRLEGIRDGALNNGYLPREDRDFLYAAAPLIDEFSRNPHYQGKDERGYLSRSSDVVDSIRKGLGLDDNIPGLTYGGKKL